MAIHKQCPSTYPEYTPVLGLPVGAKDGQVLVADSTSPLGISWGEYTRGPQGIQGATGLMGPQGPQGERGPQGIQGPAGATGRTGLQGERGPQGPEGPVGPQGKQGVPGAQGPIGPQGPVGPKGDQGPRGVPGAQGREGRQGPAGPAGTSNHAALFNLDYERSGHKGFASEVYVKSLEQRIAKLEEALIITNARLLQVNRHDG
ncbi:MAG: collagen-like protein [Clostridia bacterium]|nr:collagen-like protein [Clostridia bacterium]